jgi:hypothetical protein
MGFRWSLFQIQSRLTTKQKSKTVKSAKPIRRFFFMKTTQKLNRDFVTFQATSE